MAAAREAEALRASLAEAEAARALSDARVRTSVVESAQDLSKCRAAVTALEERLATSIAESASLREAVAIATDDAARAAGERDAQRSRADQLEKHVAALATKQAAMRLSAERSRADAAAAAAARDAATAEATEARRSATAALSQLEAALTGRAASERLVDELSRDREVIDAARRTADGGASATVAAAIRERDTVLGQLEDAAELLVAMRSRIEIAERTASDAHADAAAATAHNKALESALSDAIATHETLRRALASSVEEGRCVSRRADVSKHVLRFAWLLCVSPPPSLDALPMLFIPIRSAVAAGREAAAAATIAREETAVAVARSEGLMQQLRAAVTRITEMKEALAAAEAHRNQLDTDIKARGDRIAALEAIIAEAREREAMIAGAAEHRRRASIAAVTSELSGALMSSEHLHAELDAARQEVARVSAEARQWRVGAAAADARADEADGRAVTATQEARAQVEVVRATAKREISDAEARSADAERRVSNHTTALSAASEERDRHSSAAAGNATRIAQLEAELAVTRAASDVAATDAARARARAAEAESSLANAEREMEELHSTLSDRETQLATMMTRCEGLESELLNVLQQLRAAQKQNAADQHAATAGTPHVIGTPAGGADSIDGSEDDRLQRSRRRQKASIAASNPSSATENYGIQALAGVNPSREAMAAASASLQQELDAAKAEVSRLTVALAERDALDVIDAAARDNFRTAVQQLEDKLTQATNEYRDSAAVWVAREAGLTAALNDLTGEKAALLAEINLLRDNASTHIPIAVDGTLHDATTHVSAANADSRTDRHAADTQVALEQRARDFRALASAVRKLRRDCARAAARAAHVERDAARAREQLAHSRSIESTLRSQLEAALMRITTLAERDAAIRMPYGMPERDVTTMASTAEHVESQAPLVAHGTEWHERHNNQQHDSSLPHKAPNTTANSADVSSGGAAMSTDAARRERRVRRLMRHMVAALRSQVPERHGVLPNHHVAPSAVRR